MKWKVIWVSCHVDVLFVAQLESREACPQGGLGCWRRLLADESRLTAALEWLARPALAYWQLLLRRRWRFAEALAARLPAAALLGGGHDGRPRRWRSDGGAPPFRAPQQQRRLDRGLRSCRRRRRCRHRPRRRSVAVHCTGITVGCRRGGNGACAASRVRWAVAAVAERRLWERHWHRRHRRRRRCPRHAVAASPQAIQSARCHRLCAVTTRCRRRRCRHRARRAVMEWTARDHST
mmetsp:Transcript_42590/g.127727  ORF Transcript_42590/g.127727 Transcript_42590/m.127727 type:complete len:236 (+) Transcript_42590:809-1516(+)